MLKFIIVLLFPLVFYSLAMSQTTPTTEQWDKTYGISIQDNSFFIEEALNQEEHVVQHISNVKFFSDPNRLYAFSFTQEWPLWSMKHQFSYQLNYLYQTAPVADGIGDILLNYRYQVLEKECGVAFAPRVSLILPTGDEFKGFGVGTLGFDSNLPFSRRFSECIIAHANAGFTIYPEVKYSDSNGKEVKRSLPVYTLGGSLIWLLNPDYNLMLEYVSVMSGGRDDGGNLVFSTLQIINPGIRFAFTFEHLQIVPGCSVPIRFFEGTSDVGALVYLSFENDF